ncbi:MAG: hypothetical protein SCH66_14710 [Methanolobus sp.]|nr:hypothetical protein [Methanolobus sp.]
MIRKETNNEINDENELLEFFTIEPDSLTRPGWKYFLDDQAYT